MIRTLGFISLVTKLLGFPERKVEYSTSAEANIYKEITMGGIDILVAEYNNLWAEKLVHKEGIRKFHNYLTYIATLGSLALSFHGVSVEDFFSLASDQATQDAISQNALRIVHLFFIPFAPIVMLTLIFPINDVFHTYAIGSQLASLERAINDKLGDELLTWEHRICPVVYGGEKSPKGRSNHNLIKLGDYILLMPILALISIVASILATIYIRQNLGETAANIYFLVVSSMLLAVCYLGHRLNEYTRSASHLREEFESGSSINA